MSLLRSAATVGGLTMVSRVLGFVRDQLIAFMIGTGPVAEAFAVAQRFPNLFRALFAEGAFNAAFVPQFAGVVEGQGQAAAHRFAIEVYSVLLSWLVLFTILAMLAMPLIMVVIAPGFVGDKETFDLAVSLTRIAFPYLLFMSLTALQSGVLNSLNRFTAAAAAPILLNLALIGSNLVALALGTGNSPATGHILAWGIFVAGLLQFLLLAVACRRAGMPLVPRWPRMTPGVKRVILLSGPGIVSGGIMQVNLLIATMIATTFDRAVPYLYYADRLYQLPLGVIGVAIGVVLLPDLSRKLRAGNNPRGADQPEPRHGAVAVPDLAGDGGADGHSGAADQCAVRAWRLHAFGHAGGGADGRGLCGGAAGLLDDQGVPARLFRPRGHQDADAHRHAVGAGQHHRQPGPVALLSPMSGSPWRRRSPPGSTPPASASFCSGADSTPPMPGSRTGCRG